MRLGLVLFIHVSLFDASVPRGKSVGKSVEAFPLRGEASSSRFQLRLHYIANSNEILQEHDRGYTRRRVSSRRDTVGHEEQSTNLSQKEGATKALLVHDPAI